MDKEKLDQIMNTTFAILLALIGISLSISPWFKEVGLKLAESFFFLALTDFILYVIIFYEKFKEWQEKKK